MDLLLPKDGSIVILDDKYSQAKPLIDLLSKSGYPSIYFDGNTSNIPNEPLKKVRAVFADIQLLPGLNEQLYAQLILDHLDNLISSSNGPYVLIIWSGMLTSYAKKLEEMVTAPIFNKKPIAVIRLDKNDYFKKVATDDDFDEEAFLLNLETRFNEGDRNFILQSVKENLKNVEKKEIKSDALTSISSKIRKGLKDYKAFEWLIKWESTINNSATSFVSEIASVHQRNENWDFNFRNIIARLAHAQMGEQINKINSKDFIRSAFKTLNSAFSDSIDRSASESISISNTDFKSYKVSGFARQEGTTSYKIIWKDYSNYELYIDDIKKGDKNKIGEIHKLVNNQGQKNIVKEMIEAYNGFNPQLNSQLNVDLVTKKPFQPGILYKVAVKGRKRKRAFLDDTYFQQSIFTDKAQNNFKVPDAELDKIQFVELEISPNCDFAQNKWKKHRVISGILFPDELKISLSLQEQGDESLYKSFPLIKIDNIVYKLLLSFKLLKSFDLIDSEIKLKKVILRIKNEPMADIVTRMTSHANRIGLVQFS